MNTFAHTLLFQDSSRNKATAVYLDEDSRKIIVKSYDWDNDFLNRNNGKIKVNFPKTVKSLSTNYSPFVDGYSGVSSEQTSFSLDGTSSQIRKKLIKSTADRSSNFNSTKVMGSLINKVPKFSVIVDKKRRKERKIVLINNTTGELVIHSGLDGDSKVASNISFPKDLRLYFRNSEQDHFDLSSPGKIDQYRKSIKKKLSREGMNSFETDKVLTNIDKIRKEQLNKISKMKLIKATRRGDTLSKLFMDVESGKLYLQKTENGEISRDSFFDLSDDDSYDRLRDELVKGKMYTKEDFTNEFEDIFIQDCNSNFDTSILGNQQNIDDILAVTGKAWDNYLSKAVSKKPIMLNDGSIVTKIAHEGIEHSLKVQIDNKGNIKKIEFINKEKAQEAGLLVKEIIDGGERAFKVTSLLDGKRIDSFYFDNENINLDKNPHESRLAIYVRGASDPDMLDRQSFDKNVFDLSFNDRGITETGKKIQLSEKRGERYPTQFEKGDGSGFTTFFFKNFFSTKSRRKKIREEITQEALKTSKDLNKDGVILLSHDEVQKEVVKIVEDVERDVPRLKGSVTDITAKVYRHAYERFAKIVVPKMIEDILPGEKPETYELITNKAMEGFTLCLEAAARVSSLEGPNECMEAFEKEAPVVIGDKILQLQLEQNGYDLLNDRASDLYMKCIREDYDKESDDLDIIKACIFKATFVSVDQGLEDIVNLTLSEMSSDIDPSGKKIITIPQMIQVRAQKSLRQCYQEKGHMKEKVFSDKYDIEKLKNLEIETFKQDLFTCAAKVEEVIAVNVTEQFINENLETIDLSDKLKLQLKEDAMTNGLGRCLHVQKRQVDILKRNGKFSTVSASDCKSYVTFYVTESVVNQSLKDKTGPELWNKIQANSPSHACFKESKRIAMTEILTKKESSQDIDKESAHCLRESISWVSYFLAKEELNNIFESDPMYRNVKLSEKLKDFYAKEMQKCFSLKLKEEKNVTDISNNLDRIQDSCTVSMIMGKEAQKDILQPVVVAMLEDNDISKEIIERTTPGILRAMKKRGADRVKQGKVSLDELLEVFKGVKGTAIYFVADETVDDYVKEFIEDPKIAKAESLKLRKSLFDGKDGYRIKFVTEKNDDKLNSHIQDMTRDTAIKLTSIVTQSEAQKLLKDGILKTQKEVDRIVDSAPIIMKKCLDTFTSGEFNDHVTNCISETKATVTKNVFEDQVTSILNSDDYSAYFTDMSKEEVLKKLINPELKDEIKQAYEKDSLDDLISTFTLKATAVAAPVVIKGAISDVVFGEGVTRAQASAEKIALVDRIEDEASDHIRQCLSRNLKDGRIDSKYTDGCINSTRYKATTLVLEDILSDISKYFDKDDKRIKKLLNRGITKIKKCANTNIDTVSTDLYDKKLNACLIETVFDYVEDAVINLSENTDYMKDLKVDDLKLFKSCIGKSKKNFVDKLNNKEAKKSLYPLIEKREELWKQLFSKTDIQSKDVLEWAVDNIKSCAVSSIVPKAIDNLMSANKTKVTLGLNDSQYKFALEATTKIKTLAENEFNDNFGISFSQKTNELSEIKAHVNRGSNSNDSRKENTPTTDKERKDAIEHIESIVPLIGEYLKKLHAYDSKKSLSELDLLIESISKRKRQGEIDLDDMKEILLQSDLLNTVIISEVASIIKKEASVALEEYGLNDDEISKLVSPRILDPLFNKKNPEGRAILDAIKSQYIKPLLDGDKIDEIPEKIVKEVKTHLSSDTKMGGFVETLAGSIVQKSLDAKMPRNLASQSIAGLIGYNNGDFSWKNLRARRESGVAAKDQPVQKAIDYFGKSILKPILLNQDLGNHVDVGFFSTTKTPRIDMRKEKFEDMVKDLMDL
mgnify:CR=1 FL=1